MLLGATGTVAAVGRTSLWSVVQVCIANDQLTGASFPCLEVDAGQRGFVTIRAPFEKTHVIVSPTVHISGIEDPSLQSADAPHIFQQAWDARKFIVPRREPSLADADIGLALNSRPGRSQDQIHVHVDCLSSPIAQQLHMHESEMSATQWSHLAFALRGERYWVMLLSGTDLAEKNIFTTASTLLNVSPGRIEDVTLVVIPRPGGGFYLLADQFIPHSLHKGHGEVLLDHSCSGA